MKNPLPALENEPAEVSVIIVSYNAADWLRVCLDSLAADPEGRKEVFVVDNASTDESVALLRQNYSWVHLLANKENRGFGAANNQALPRCRENFVFFLNPDTQVVPGSLRKLISFMRANPSIGLAGSGLISPEGKPQESISYRYPGQSYTTTELTGLKGSIAWVLGASMMARAAVLRKVGGFDEDFFLYGEEQDLCLRIRKAGHEIGYCPEAVVVHRGGHSERESTSAEIWAKKAKAEYLFYQKHYRADSIARIRRSHLIKACWRMATLTLFFPFVRNKGKAKEKLAKYRSSYHEAKYLSREKKI